jgi:hypothetical protein
LLAGAAVLFGPNGTPAPKQVEATAPEKISPPRPEPTPFVPPSAEDQQHLEGYEAKLQLVRDYTRELYVRRRRTDLVL